METPNWQTYRVFMRHPTMGRYTQTTTALDYADAKATFLNLLAIKEKLAEGYKLTQVKLDGGSTPKQKLAQKYGFIIGGIKGSRLQFTNVILATDTTNPQLRERIYKARDLVGSQFSKLERDIRDCFKLAGLKVK